MRMRRGLKKKKKKFNAGCSIVYFVGVEGWQKSAHFLKKLVILNGYFIRIR